MTPHRRQMGNEPKSPSFTLDKSDGARRSNGDQLAIATSIEALPSARKTSQDSESKE